MKRRYVTSLPASLPRCTILTRSPESFTMAAPDLPASVTHRRLEDPSTAYPALRRHVAEHRSSSENSRCGTGRQLLCKRREIYGSGGGIRTPDPAVNSRLLYH